VGAPIRLGTRMDGPTLWLTFGIIN
jgi:hypothetical protein